MPKFARPTSYTGKQSNQSWTGDTRGATPNEATAGKSKELYISPAVLASSIGALVNTSLTAPGPIGSVTPNTGAFTTLTSTGTTTLASGAGAAAKLGNATGTVGFFGATGAVKATQAAITNSVTAGGTTGTIANYTDLTVYANDSNAIRNDIYQLSLALSNVITALRAYGLFT